METKIILVDDNLEGLNTLESDLNSTGLKVIAKCQTADDCINAIQHEKPDIIITDIILQGQDGFELIEKLKTEFTNIKVLVLSKLSNDAFIGKAMDCGADYYMIKPYNKDTMIKRINEILNDENAFSLDKKQIKQIEEKISNIFITVGIPAHIKGYQFLREAIKMAIDDPSIINSITKRLYPDIAEKFETSPSKVERAIRHAIEVAWNRGKIENINTLFGIKVYSNNEKPTNGEFIALVADKMLLEGV